MDRKRERLVREMHCARHLVENFFCQRKPFRGIATRYDETKRNFPAGVHLAASAIPLN
jgi:transposase